MNQQYADAAYAVIICHEPVVKSEPPISLETCKINKLC